MSILVGAFNPKPRRTGCWITLVSLDIGSSNFNNLPLFSSVELKISTLTSFSIGLPVIEFECIILIHASSFDSIVVFEIAISFSFFSLARGGAVMGLLDKPDAGAFKPLIFLIILDSLVISWAALISILGAAIFVITGLVNLEIFGDGADWSATDLELGDEGAELFFAILLILTSGGLANLENNLEADAEKVEDNSESTFWETLSFFFTGVRVLFLGADRLVNLEDKSREDCSVLINSDFLLSSELTSVFSASISFLGFKIVLGFKEEIGALNLIGSLGLIEGGAIIDNFFKSDVYIYY